MSGHFSSYKYHIMNRLVRGYKWDKEKARMTIEIDLSTIRARQKNGYSPGMVAQFINRSNND